MNAEDQNQDFEKLQRLLKLKRYEQPPPRYFNDFSSQVVARLNSAKSGRHSGSFDAFFSRSPWLRRLWHALESRPAVSGVLTAAVCGLMVAGVFISENTPQTFDALAVGGGGEPVSGPALAGTATLGASFAGAPQLVSSTNLGAIQSLFDNIAPIQTMPISGTPLFQK